MTCFNAFYWIFKKTIYITFSHTRNITLNAINRIIIINRIKVRIILSKLHEWFYQMFYDNQNKAECTFVNRFSIENKDL